MANEDNITSDKDEEGKKVPSEVIAAQSLRNIDFPEIFFGLVAPIGVDTKLIVASLKTNLDAVGYDSMHIKVTELMKDIKTGVHLQEHPVEVRYDTHIRFANAVRELFDTSDNQSKGNDALATLAISGVVAARKKLEASGSTRRAYILDQFKRPEEIVLMRKVYGRLFVLISVHATRDTRKNNLIRKIRKSHADPNEIDCSVEAERLINRDHHEEKERYGQRVRNSFHMADVFIDGNNRENAEHDISRLVKLFFGNNFITPTHDEYGMFMAKAAALRSADLSRQVGAAIFAARGEIITLGANEVPKASGGTYFEGDKPDRRDYTEGSDYNEDEKRNLLLDVLQRLDEKGCLIIPDQKHHGTPLSQKLPYLLEDERGPQLRDSRVMDVLEFGRQIHAEMSALVDAARLGRSVMGATLYCTTFPCHMCTKLILGAGIARVVFIEPYPKSFAEPMYPHAIALEGTSSSTGEPQVVFQPFTGVAPFRYKEFFEKGRRKASDGSVRPWKDGHPRPNVNLLYAAYLHFEDFINRDLLVRLGTLKKRPSMSSPSAPGPYTVPPPPPPRPEWSLTPHPPRPRPPRSKP